MFKAIALGIILTGSIAVVVGSQGSSGGVLGIHKIMVSDFKLYWSWPLFFAGTGLSWGLIMLQK